MPSGGPACGGRPADFVTDAGALSTLVCMSQIKPYVKRNPRRQGDLGEWSAISWFRSQGLAVFLPIGHSPDYDMVAEWRDGVARIQVKTSTVLRKDRWDVTVCTRGGNQSWNGVVKHLDPARYDYLFVVVGDGRRWLIPAAAVAGGSGIRLGGPKYAQYEIAPGEALSLETASLDSALASAGFPSGQRDETVNLAAQPSQVRILPPP
jgi:hypothetical protein